jgi:hypothetical protein
VIARVDASSSFGFYKKQPDENNWNSFFAEPLLEKPHSASSEFGGFLLNHSRYRYLDFERAQPLVAAFFRPAPDVVAKTWFLVEKYGVDVNRTLAVNYRGTDKGQEIRPVPLDRWIWKIRQISSRLPDDYRILVQTDQLQFRELCVKEFGNRVIYFDELPVTSGLEPFHNIVPPEKGEELAQWLLAAVFLISQCRSVVTHTGNVAYWTALYRGSHVGLTQMR